jgi:hypothetical protein
VPVGAALGALPAANAAAAAVAAQIQSVDGCAVNLKTNGDLRDKSPGC